MVGVVGLVSIGSVVALENSDRALENADSQVCRVLRCLVTISRSSTSN